MLSVLGIFQIFYILFILVQWMSKNRMFEIGKTPKSKLLTIRISDNILCPKSELFSLDFGRQTSLDIWDCRAIKFYYTVKFIVPSVVVRISDIQKHSKSERFSSDFGQIMTTKRLGMELKLLCQNPN